ncbi:MAG: YqaA family protein [Gammaproteobacteria bacterium]|jgi:membrane protein YqaA with SNARE-associated domain
MPDSSLSLWGLFTSAFLSSTLLPGSSELLLIYLVNQSSHPLPLLLTMATVGNTLGGMTTYGLGRLLAWRFPNRPLRQQHQTALDRLQRWGSFALLLSWVPIIGDPLCAAAGYLKTNVFLTLILMGLGKLARYAFIIAAAPGFASI